jgi:ketopantoate reductase
MPATPQHHVIVGPGGIGGYLAALLSAAGEHVTVIVRAHGSSQFHTLNEFLYQLAGYDLIKLRMSLSMISE